MPDRARFFVLVAGAFVFQSVPQVKTITLLAALALAAISAPAQEAPPAAPATGLFPAASPAGPTTPRSRAARGAKGRRKSRYATDAAVSQASADPLAVRVAYRKAKTMAMVREPGLRELLLQADAAPTDDEKRAFLKVYYTKLYATIRKIDPSPAMKSHVDLLSSASQQRYDPKRRAVDGEDDLAGIGRNGGRNRR